MDYEAHSLNYIQLITVIMGVDFCSVMRRQSSDSCNTGSLDTAIKLSII